MSKFLHNHDKNDAKAIAIPRVFSENSQAKNLFQNGKQNETITL